MITARKIRIFTLVVAAFALAAVFVFTITDNVALADDFDVLFPTEGYVQTVSSDLIAANEDYVAVCDNTNGKISVTGIKTASFSTSGLSVKGIHVFGDTLLVDSAEGFKSCDLSASVLTFSDASLPTPTAISYLTTDGVYLYAHASGTVAKYDDALTLQNTYLDSAFTDKPVFVSDGEKIYLYPVEYGVYKYAVYDTASGNSSKVNSTITACAAAIGDVIFVHNTSSVLCVSKTDGALLFDTHITSLNFAAFNDRLYVANGLDGYSVYSLNADLSGVTLSAVYAMSGSELDKLNSPSDFVLMNQTKVIADTGNNRVLFAGSGVSALSMTAPKHLTVGKNRIYAANANSVSVIENGAVTASYALSGITDVVYFERLYIIAENKLFTLIGGTIEELASIPDGIALAACEDGNLLYALTESGVRFLNKQGKDVLPAYQTQNNKDFAVDYVGNVFLLKENDTVEKINLLGVYAEEYLSAAPTQPVTYGFTNVNYSATPLSVFLHTDGKIYFAAHEHFVGSIEVDAITKNDFTPTVKPDTASAEVKPYRVKNATVCYSEPKRQDTAKLVSANDTVYVFETETGLNGYKYGVYQDEIVFIADDGSLEALQIDAINGEYITTSATTLFRYPNSAEGNMPYALRRTIRIIDNAGDADGSKWYRTKYNDVFYYVARADLEAYVAPVEQPETKTVYGKAKAERAGGLVNIYLSADTTSTVITSITDGTEVVIINETDGFYFVECGDYTGYMLKDTVALDGLTTVQIVAIVLSVIVVFAGIGVYFVTKRIKRDAEEKE